ncbi:NAD(+) synthase [Halorarum salinum]|uniref:NH(3)-dependent NAD(+) synthetase n=1 Tax=Halorarum salinum TaxID=2743089 RepID=A0A7D5QCA0_9EURY|nr:NAD(+) synthase [Halobaculum salinum]QLG63617.1 NAD(+) synthase [Halobaculum salinum]
MTGGGTDAPDAGPAEPRRPFGTDADELASTHGRATAFVRSVVDRSGAEGVVVVLRGGLDSTVAATVAVDALGADDVVGLVLPCSLSSEADARDAEAVADLLGIEAVDVQLRPLFEAFRGTVGAELAPSADTVATMNVVARLRMTCAYYLANATGRLVVGSVTRTDRLLGDPTKYGDGAADLHPLGSLFETEVRALAERLDVPEFVAEKPSRGNLWTGYADERSLDAPVETVDRVLAAAVESNLDVDATAAALGVEADLVERVIARHAGSRHKRRRPLRPGPDGVGWTGS